MSQREGRRRVVLHDFKARKADEGAIDVELSDGSTITIPPPVLWPDEAIQAAMRNDVVASARMVLGDDTYERFTGDGGSAMLLDTILRDELGVGTGD